MARYFVVAVLFFFSYMPAQDLSWLGKKLDYSDTLRLCDIYKNMNEALVAPEKVENLELVIDKRDRKSTRLNSSHIPLSRMPSSA